MSQGEHCFHLPVANRERTHAICEECGEVFEPFEVGMVKVLVDALECANCGWAPMELWTEADQNPKLHPDCGEEMRSYEYWCCDGDPVICPDCGAYHWMSVDSESCYMTWDW